jgi:hypothetical protein
MTKDKTAMMCNWSQQMNKRAWNPQGLQNIPPATDCCGKTFLDYPNTDLGAPSRFMTEDIRNDLYLAWESTSVLEEILPCGRSHQYLPFLLILK